MRRLLSFTLVLFFALPLVAPAFGQTAQQKLLLCCRRAGAHHCVTSATMEDGSPAPTFREHCSACPKAAVACHAADSLITGGEFAATASSTRALRIRQVEAGYRISFHRSRHKRGPPATFLS